MTLELVVFESLFRKGDQRKSSIRRNVDSNLHIEQLCRVGKTDVIAASYLTPGLSTQRKAG